MKSLAIAATGMNAQQTNLEVIANNIANINTTAFKRARAEFTDLFYQMDRMQGVANIAAQLSRSRKAPIIGLGVKLGGDPQPAHPGRADADRQHLRPGASTAAAGSRSLGPNNEALYTRAGSFNTNANGQLVTADGYLLDPGHHGAAGTRSRSPSTRPARCLPSWIDGSNPRQIGQLNLANFANEAGLEPLGSNLYRETTASGTPVVGAARRSRLRQDQPALSRSLERRSGQGNHRVDLGAARLRNECQGHPGVG